MILNELKWGGWATDRALRRFWVPHPLSLVPKGCGFRVNVMLAAQTTGTYVDDRYGNRWAAEPRLIR